MYKTIPHDHVSARNGSYGALADNISGAAYTVDPQYVVHSSFSSTDRANPKSATFSVPLFDIRQFSLKPFIYIGLTKWSYHFISRWTIPSWCK